MRFDVKVIMIRSIQQRVSSRKKKKKKAQNRWVQYISIAVKWEIQLSMYKSKYGILASALHMTDTSKDLE